MINLNGCKKSSGKWLVAAVASFAALASMGCAGHVCAPSNLQPPAEAGAPCDPPSGGFWRNQPLPNNNQCLVCKK